MLDFQVVQHPLLIHPEIIQSPSSYILMKVEFLKIQREADRAERECERVKVQVSTVHGLQVTHSPPTLGPRAGIPTLGPQGGREFPGIKASHSRSQQLGMQFFIHVPFPRDALSARSEELERE